ncbi:MarR family transcriptional regulator [Clostridium sp. OS1-26]|uniref:MarR family winged helix-turn-helix transcriptional regulator n=1 Tax=Clostridium sp. OS1-26 TaxID=3070681 RepID=UPI0027DED628|nr:MarR family transcriptional regulator [Clostridium sp. OS1-26]WML36992.1 MarR family transcriptional regulator [Clostridium sp. OS1-26]
MTSKDDYVSRAQNALWNTTIKIADSLRDLSEFGVTEAQFHVLELLYRKGSCKVTYLAEIMGVKPSAITTMIDRLANNGLVYRRHDDNDRRAVLVDITNEGQELIDRFDKKCRETLRKYLTHLEPNELESLASIYEKLGNIDI